MMLLTLLWVGGLGCLIQTDRYEAQRAQLVDDDGDGQHELDGDCDDAEPAAYDGAPEVCDGVDNDCDGTVDEDDAADTQQWYADADGDGFGTEADGVVTACDPPAGHAAQPGDCDESDASIHPDAEEIWYDGVDQDCRGDDDYDADDDGDPAEAHGGADCDDEDPTRYDGAVETIKDFGEDNDCDGSTEDAISDPLSSADLLITPPAGVELFGILAGPAVDINGDGVREHWISAPYATMHAARDGAVFLVDVNVPETTELTLDTSTPHIYGRETRSLFSTGARNNDDMLFSTSQDFDGDGAVYLILEDDLMGLSGGHRVSELASSVLQGTNGSGLGVDLIGDIDSNGDGSKDLITNAHHSRELLLFEGGEGGDRSQDDADLAWRSPMQSGYPTPYNVGDVDDDGYGDLGVKMGDAEGDDVIGTVILFGPLGDSSGDLIEDGSISFLSTPALGEVFTSPFGDRLLPATEWQAFLLEAPTNSGTYDLFDIADYNLFRRGEDGPFSDAMYLGWFGAVGPVLLAAGPHGPSGNEQGGCTLWQSREWSASSFAHEAQAELVGDAPGDNGCSGVSLVDDINTDTSIELLLGAPGSTTSNGETGQAYLILSP